MTGRTGQRGMTFWGLLFVLGVITFFVFLTFKLFPPYLQDFKVKAALESVAKSPEVARLSKAEIVEALDRRFEIDDVQDVDPAALRVELRGRTKTLQLRYEKVIPLMFNISALLEFEHTREVPASE